MPYQFTVGGHYRQRQQMLATGSSSLNRVHLSHVFGGRSKSCLWHSTGSPGTATGQVSNRESTCWNKAKQHNTTVCWQVPVCIPEKYRFCGMNNVIQEVSYFTASTVSLLQPFQMHHKLLPSVSTPHMYVTKHNDGIS